MLRIIVHILSYVSILPRLGSGTVNVTPIYSLTLVCYDYNVMTKLQIPGGTVHAMPSDLHAALAADQVALDAWNDITVLARNEWICWVESAKLIQTRDRRISRVITELAEGKRRPCCWPGCMHRDKNRGHSSSN